ncbi:dystroglycan 1-like [Melitaea cinxia]|uniref:dystroglycan 1-like n=1 Tax=Melitaea cinxia TaxID=113334 RepID=UPI001E27094B|nr:dystroglycan 1-like [Melitaea cinxia]
MASRSSNLSIAISKAIISLTIAEDSDKNVAYDNIHVELQVIIEPSVNLLFSVNNKRKIIEKRPTNEPPTLHHKFKKLGVIAGKPFRYIIPPDAFTDLEDGSNLTYTVFKSEHVPLSQESWLQFNSNERILYGLPLIEHVDRWNYIIEAKDSDGGTAQGTLDIRVQLHRRTRNNNHQFTMKVKPLKRFQNTIDWQIRALEGIANIHKDANFDHLLVLNVTQIGDVYEFTWMNDTLPQYPCPVNDIKKLMKVMESETEHGSPSSDLINAMTPDLQVLEITWRGTGQCATIEPITPNVSVNYPPILRNTIDHLTARVGHLLVYRVPEDTFFDPEDGSTRSLHLSLRFSDNSPIPSNHWLQFDAQKQELSGVPSPNDVNDVNYVLV